MQINRLFEIVYLLLNKNTLTAKQLAEHFEVSVRTILRDIDTLSSAGIPVYTKQGHGGGISLVEGYTINKALFSEKEQRDILHALQGSFAADKDSLGAAVSKLGAMFSQNTQDWIEVDFSRWGHGKQDNQKFQLLKGAILDCLEIEFQYVSSGGTSATRNIYPLKLVFKSQSWYLQGYCLARNDYRTFKINRIISVNITNRSFQGHKFIPPPIEGRVPAVPAIIIDLLFSPGAAHRLYDTFDEGSISKTSSGAYHVHANLPEDQWLYSFLLSFGNDVEILSPESLKEKLCSLKK